jgi:hypothetical protein
MSLLLFSTQSSAQHALANFDSGGLNYALLAGKRFYSLAVVSAPKMGNLDAKISTEDQSIIIDIPTQLVEQDRAFDLIDTRFSKLRIAKNRQKARLILDYESKQKPLYRISRSDVIDMLVIEIEFPSYADREKKKKKMTSAAPELKNVQLVMATTKSLIDSNEQINTLVPKNTSLDPKSKSIEKIERGLTQISPLHRKDSKKSKRRKSRSNAKETKITKVEEFPLSALRSYKPGKNGLPQEITPAPPTALQLKVAKMFKERREAANRDNGTIVRGLSFTPSRGNSFSAVMIEVEGLKEYSLDIIDAETIELTIDNAKLAHSRLELPVYADENVRGYDVMRAEYRDKSLVLEIKTTEKFKPNVYTTSGYLWISSLE